MFKRDHCISANDASIIPNTVICIIAGITTNTCIGSNLPSIKINKKSINNKLDIIDLVILSKLEKSKSEIRRLIKGNAVKINDKVISDEKLIVTNELFNENYLKLSIGKKRHLKIELD